MKRNSKPKERQQEQEGSRWKIRLYETVDETELTDDEQYITLIEQEKQDADNDKKSAGAAFS